MASTPAVNTYLKGGEEYRQSLRDGREVHYLGERVEDVTTHLATAGGIDEIAQLYDEQHSPEGEELLTYVREDGERVTASYLVPRTREDLAFRRRGIEYVTRRTFGAHGRGIDMIATLPIGMLGHLPTFAAACPEYADNIAAYLRYAEENNIHLAETIVDPQGYRSRGGGTSPDTLPPERAAARIVKESSEGIWISGVKGVGTAAPQANEMLIGSFHPPQEQESFWVVVPANAPGLRMYCREVVHRPGSNAYDHPLTHRGEEAEAIVAFDEVFVPNERILAMKRRELHTANFYNQWARHEHWYTQVRISVKAELYAGLAQLIVDTLELGEIPAVRQRVGDIFEYAQVLRGMLLAAEELAEPSEGGVMTPNVNVTTAARSYSLALLPQVIHILQDIAGQGLILRFGEADLEKPAAFGKNLAWFLDTRNVSAREKNLVMNLVWDLTASEHAARTKLFEESNALNVPFLKERLYGEYDRSLGLRVCRDLLGIGPGPEHAWQARIEQRWNTNTNGAA